MAFVIVDLRHLQPFSHRPSLGDPHPQGNNGRGKPNLLRHYIAAEATANAVRHSNASHVTIALARTARALQLTITDDGTGGAAFGEGTGLQGLRDRADAAGGCLTLVSPAGGPTIVTAALPDDGDQATRR